jgi:hypothetical protein
MASRPPSSIPTPAYRQAGQGGGCINGTIPNSKTICYHQTMYHIKELLPKVLKKRGLQDHAKASHVILHTQEWIITELEGYQDQLIAKSFKDGILLINAENSVCAQELNQVLLELKEHLSEKGHNILEIRIIRSQ